MIPTMQIVLVMCVLALTSVALAAELKPPGPPPQAEPLWPGDAPGSEGVENTERTENYRIFDVSVPAMAYYPAPKDKATGTAVVVCPGGAFRRLAIGHEGYGVAEWLNTLGVSAFVLKYRCGKILKSNEDVERLTVADGMRAIRTVRYKADKLGIDPKRIGIMGFSAGGNLAGRIVARLDEDNAESEDPIDRMSFRPDFVVLLYSSVRTLKASKINEKTPPFFMVQAANDRIPNDDCAKLFIDLYAAKVPAALHIFATGGHGFGLGNRGGTVTAWPKLFAEWLAETEKYQKTFAPDYLASVGGESSAELKPGMTVAYKDLDGEDKTATVGPANANQKGEVMSRWAKENMGRRIGYAFCYLRSDTDQRVKCKFGGSDEARVWINGKLAVSNDRSRDYVPGDYSFDVDLKEGLNPVMVKVSQRTGMWAFKLEAVGTPPAKSSPAEQGKPVNDLTEDGEVTKWNTMSFHVEKLKK